MSRSEFDDAGNLVLNERDRCLCGHELAEHGEDWPGACQAVDHANIDDPGRCTCLRFRAAEPEITDPSSDAEVTE